MSSARATATASAEERATLLLAAITTALIPLNSTMIALALPPIVGEFEVTFANTSWLVSGYLIAMVALQPLAGKLGDRFDRRKVLVAGLGLFGLASAGAAAAPALPALIAFRLLQAVAGALMFPNAMAQLRERLPEERRAAGFGVISAAVGLAAAAGLPIGGAVVGLLDWRAMFLLNVPIVGAALWLASRTAATERARREAVRFDVAGALILTAALIAGAGLLNRIDTLGVGLWLPGGLLVGAALTLFIRLELRHPDPVIQPRFFTRSPFSAATAAIALSNLALYGTLLAVPVVLGGPDGRSTEVIGLILTAFAITMVIFSVVGGRTADRIGRRPLAVWGGILLGVSLLPLAVAGEDVSLWLLVPFLAAGGAGIGLSNPALQTAGIEALDARDAGVAAGVFSSGRYLGGIVAASLLALLTDLTQPSAGLTPLFAVGVVAALASACLALVLPSRGGMEAPLATRPARAGD